MTDLEPPPGYDTPADLTGITELRVHGVSGTAPAVMLQFPVPEQVVPGRLTGFYRRPRWADRGVLAGEAPVGGHPRRVEAYAWGNLTSGASSRALWLLLLPFAIVNMAAWMHPAPRPDDRGARVGPAGIGNVVWRLLALSLTATLVLTAVGIGPDLVGWQCAARADCAPNHWYTRFLGTGWWHQPSRAVAAASLVPAGLLALLWWLGRASWHRYELPRPLTGTGGDDVPLARADFWNGRHLVGVLRGAHVGIGLACIAVFLTVPALRGQTGAGRRIGTVLLALGLLTAASSAVLAATAVRRADTSARRAARQSVAGRILEGGGLAVTLASAGYALASRGGPPRSAELPGFTGTIFWLFVGQLVLVLLAAVLSRARPQPRRDRPQPALHGLAGPLLALLAVGLGAGMTAGGTVRIADLLLTPPQPNPGGPAPKQAALAVPEEYGYAALGFGAVLLAFVVAVTLAALRIRARARRRPAADEVLADPAYRAQREDALAGHPGADALAAYDDDARRRARAVARMRLLAGCTDDLGPWIAGPVAAVAVVSAVAAVVTYAPLRIDTTVHPVSVAYTVCSWLLGLLPIALVLLYRAAHTSSAKRHRIGILWDLTTFWPRAIHPLAPPCYGERAVPDVTDRIRLLTRDGAVILSTHSQGTVIGLAVLFQLEPAARERTFLLTYGSPLARLYAPYWPAYFGGAALEAAYVALGGEPGPLGGPAPGRPAGKRAADPVDPATPRWRNVWRLTDPFGGTVFPRDPVRRGNVDSLPLADPAALVLRPGDVEPAPIRGHADYFDDPEFHWLADRAARRLTTILG